MNAAILFAVLIESVAGSSNYRVTFQFHGEAERVQLVSNVLAEAIPKPGVDLESIGYLERGAGDLWQLTLTLPAASRVPYSFRVERNGKSDTVLDQLQFWNASVLELPAAPPQPWRGQPSHGTWQSETIAGKEVRVFLPRGFDRQRAYPLIVAFDPATFGAMQIDAIAETLADRGEIDAPVIAVVPAEPAASVEALDTSSAQAKSIVDHLRSSMNIRTVIISGASRRGLMAAYAAFRNPGTFAGVISLSGAFYWRPDGELEWFSHLVATSPRSAVRFFLSAGTFEHVVTERNLGHYPLSTTRHLRDVLIAKGADVTYYEFAGTHDELCWSDAFAEGLRRLLTPATLRPAPTATP